MGAAGVGGAAEVELVMVRCPGHSIFLFKVTSTPSSTHFSTDVTLQLRHREGALVFVRTGRSSGLCVMKAGGTPSTGLKVGQDMEACRFVQNWQKSINSLECPGRWRPV